MEWTEAHDLILAKEVRASEPWMFKPRTVDRGKVWNAITDHLNDETSVKFQVKKKQVQEHFKLLLDKFKAKRKHQAKLSGVEIEDSKMDILMEEISEKWEEAEASDLGFDVLSSHNNRNSSSSMMSSKHVKARRSRTSRKVAI